MAFGPLPHLAACQYVLCMLYVYVRNFLIFNVLSYMHCRSWLHENFNAVDDERISQKFSDYNAYDGYGNVRPHQAEYYCYAFAYDRKKGEKAHPCATAGHEAFGSVEFFFVHVQVFFNSVYASEHADAIVEHASEHVAYCAVNN